MKLTNENAFVGAIVTYNKEKHYVVKVNAKSVYLTPNKDFLKKWEAKDKGVTWKSFCERHNGFMIKYGDIEISEAEASAKDSFIEAKKSSKRFLTHSQEKEVIGLFNEAVKAFEGKKHRAWAAPTISGFNIITVNIKDKILLIRKGTDRFFYDIDNDIYVAFSKETHHKNEELIWPEKIERKEKIA